MSDTLDDHSDVEAVRHSPHRVRLPRFVLDDDIGWGDVMKRATSYLGIVPCGSCARRADAMNRWLVFTRGQGE
jgi:hypothetical protein